MDLIKCDSFSTTVNSIDFFFTICILHHRVCILYLLRALSTKLGTHGWHKPYNFIKDHINQSTYSVPLTGLHTKFSAKLA